MKIIDTISNFCKSITGIISLSIMVASIGSGLLLRHDAKNILTFVKQNKTLSGHDVDSIFTLRINPVEKQIATIITNGNIRHYRDSIDASKDKAEMIVVKKGLTDYWTAKKEFDAVITFQQNLLNAMNDLKKKD
jgi:hypothetical protein